MEKNWFLFLKEFLFGYKNNIFADCTSFEKPYLNKEAVVLEIIHPGRNGRVRCEGSFWPARCTQSITLRPGTLVRVKGLDNITLLVEPTYNLLPPASQQNVY